MNYIQLNYGKLSVFIEMIQNVLDWLECINKLIRKKNPHTLSHLDRNPR